MKLTSKQKELLNNIENKNLRKEIKKEFKKIQPTMYISKWKFLEELPPNPKPENLSKEKLEELTNPNALELNKWYKVSEYGIDYYWFLQEIDFEELLIRGFGFSTNKDVACEKTVLYRNPKNFNWFLKNAILDDLSVLSTYTKERLNELLQKGIILVSDYITAEAKKKINPKEDITPKEKLEFDLPKKEYNKDLDYLLLPESNHLCWIYNRLLTVHCENPNYDYMLKLRDIILKENEKQYTLEDMRKCFDESKVFDTIFCGYKYRTFEDYINSLK